MASKPKYAELTFPRVSHSLLGYDIVSERHTEDGSTHLFLKLREREPKPVAKPKRKRQPKAEVARTPEPVLAQ